EESLDITEALRTLNRKTFKSIAVMLPEDAARTFRKRYYTEAYPMVGAILSFDMTDRFEKVMGVKDLPTEQQEQLAVVIGDHRRQLDRMVEAMVELSDEQRQGFTVFDFDQEAMQEYHRKFAKLRTEATELVSTTMRTLQEILGDKKLARLLAHATTRPGDGEVVAEAALVEAMAGAVVVEIGSVTHDGRMDKLHKGEGNVIHVDPFVGPSISRADVARYAERLGLDEQKRPVLEALHTDYLTSFRQLDALQELPKASASLWHFDRETGTATPASDAVIDRIHRLRRQAGDAVRQLDGAFFDDVRALVGDDRARLVERLRADRLRRTYSIGSSMYAFGQSGTAEGGLDLGDLVDKQRLGPEDAAGIDSILTGYGQSASDAFRARYEATLEMQRATEQWTAAAQRGVQDAGAQMELAQRYQKIMGPPSKRVAEAGQTIAELNRASLGELIEALPRAAAESLRRAYNKAAFPTVYTDPAAVGDRLTAAMQLDDLTSEQRSSLEELAASYRPTYEELSRKLVELAKQGQINPMNFETVDWQAYQQRTEQVQRLRFDRDELNDRAAIRLKAVLRDEQIQRIGGLPKPKEENRRFMPW
ncbi:MAG: hypothetical protein IH804_10490, partial [Planctomycetes bacterium]|nr:hypothetical protein [Planctomycetota bacterium]